MDYGYGPNSALIAVTDRCEVEACDEDGDNESDGDGDVQVDGHVPSFLTINQLMENEQGRYISMDVPSCDVSNNPDPEDPDERGTVNYYFGNIVSSDWTP